MIDQPEDSTILNQNEKSRHWQACASFFRWTFIVLFASALLAGLYFNAPWKILTLVAILLAMLTVVPKSYRKYGWATLGVIVFAVTIWVFIPEKSSGDWKIYEFEDERAALENKRILPPEADAAPLYLALFEQWKEIKKSDPFPEEIDKDCVTQSQPWSASEFPQLAAWFARHDAFFQDLIDATKKSGCFFPAAVTTLELTDSLERTRPWKQLAQHLIRASYLEIGENRGDGLKEQLAVLSMGKHINQQPLLIDILTGIAIEGLARQALLKTLMNAEMFSHLTSDEICAIKAHISASHFEHNMKLKQILAYEKLFAKNCFGWFYEINSEHKIRFTRFETMLRFYQDMCPEKQPRHSYWKVIGCKFSRLKLWFSGLSDPRIISEWTDESYRPMEKIFHTEGFERDQLNPLSTPPFELNYEYVVKRTIQILMPSFKSIRRILIDTSTRKQGAELVCDLVLYNKVHGEYPDSIKELWSSNEKANASQYSEFVYEKIDDSFKLYGIGQNGIDEEGRYRMPKSDPNDSSSYYLLERKAEPDDIMIWPQES